MHLKVDDAGGVLLQYNTAIENSYLQQSDILWELLEVNLKRPGFKKRF